MGRHHTEATPQGRAREEIRVNPILTRAPDQVLRPGNGNALLAWLQRNGAAAPTLLQIEQERARRGLRRKKGKK